MERREFLFKAGVAAAAGSALLSSCAKEEKGTGPAINSGKKYHWKMVTSWQPNYPVLGEAASEFAKNADQLSGGRLKINVYGGNELVPPLEVFDAVSGGMTEMGHSVAYYWAGKTPASQFFTSMPFGMNTAQTNAWLYFGGGLELWEKLYSRFNLIPFPCGNTGGQMGGWFNQAINSLADLKGLKIRLPGIGGKVLTEAGASAVLSPGSEIYTNLERGVIDATEWVGPYHDYLMGFQKISNYYYYPGWHEPTGVLELTINKAAWDSLTDDLKQVIKLAASAANDKIYALSNYKNAEYLEKLKKETEVNILPFPKDVIEKFREISADIMNGIAKTDKLAAEIYKSYKNFQQTAGAWTEISEFNYKV